MRDYRWLDALIEWWDLENKSVDPWSDFVAMVDEYKAATPQEQAEYQKDWDTLAWDAGQEDDGMDLDADGDDDG